MRPILLFPLGFILPMTVSAVLASSFLRDMPLLPSLITPSPEFDFSGKGIDRMLPPLTDAEAAHVIIATRPLFAENRQLKKVAEVETGTEPEPEPEPIPETYVEEVPEPAAVVKDPLPVLPNLEAIGYTSENGKTRVLISTPATGTESWMSVGDLLDGWTLVEITQEAATFEYDGTQAAIKLFK
jgi:hypothetical protein